MTKTEELALVLIGDLDDFHLSREEKIKAIGIARNHLNSPNSDLEKWRDQRLARGPFTVVKKGRKAEE